MPTLNIQGYPANLVAHQVTIPAGTATSELFSTQGMALVAICMPTTTWTAADIGFASSWDGSVQTTQQIYNSAGTPEKTKAVKSVNIDIPMTDTSWGPWLQLLSVSTTDDVTPVNQVGAAVITLILRKYHS